MTSKWIETNGFHRKVATWSFVVILTEIGGSDVKAVVLHEQTSMDEARKTAVEDNPGYRFKGLMPLTDRDFAKGEK